MSKPTRLKFKKFLKAVRHFAKEKFARFNEINSSGSAIRFEVFLKQDDEVPHEMWTVHRDDVVWTNDLKKTYENLCVSKEDFLKVANEM